MVTKVLRRTFPTSKMLPISPQIRPRQKCRTLFISFICRRDNKTRWLVGPKTICGGKWTRTPPNSTGWNMCGPKNTFVTCPLKMPLFCLISVTVHFEIGSQKHPHSLKTKNNTQTETRMNMNKWRQGRQGGTEPSLRRTGLIAQILWSIKMFSLMQKCRKNVCGGQKFNRHPETKINYQAQTPIHPQVEAAAAAEVRRESLFKLLLLYIISFLIALFACISRYRQSHFLHWWVSWCWRTGWPVMVG